MAQFQVPQFIETEDKIVGPLTLRQSLYLAAAGLILFLSFFILKTFLWFILAAFIGTAAALMAFVKFNGQPMHKAIFAMLNYAWHPRFYLWKSPLVQPSSPRADSAGSPRVEEIEAEKISPISKKSKRIASAPQAIAGPKFVPLEGAVPIAEIAPPAKPVAPSRIPAPKMEVESKLASPKKPLLKSLWFKLQTSAASIRPAAKDRQSEEKYAIIRKITGEKEKVRRIDYR